MSPSPRLERAIDIAANLTVGGFALGLALVFLGAGTGWAFVQLAGQALMIPALAAFVLLAIPAGLLHYLGVMAAVVRWVSGR